MSKITIQINLGIDPSVYHP